MSEPAAEEPDPEPTDSDSTDHEPANQDQSASAFDLPTGDLIELFQSGEMEIEGRMPYSSNTTLLVTVTDEAERSHRAIYKPARGERPLWDFPGDLYKREVAMFRLADALGWDVVPPTTVGSGPYGEGSVQAFVDADFEQHYFTLHEDGVGRDDLERLCALDLIANNTDRKSGHCLLGRDGRIYGIDHGLSFHAQFKLRTVMWDYVDQPLPEAIVQAITKFLDDGPEADFICLLDTFELDAVLARAEALLEAGTFPDDETGGRRWPWPLV